METVQLADRIIQMHEAMRGIWPELSRLAVALYDKDTQTLQTFLNSTDRDGSLRNYSAKLADVPSLKELADSRKPRILQDLTQLATSQTYHSRWLLESDFRSSYTVPMFGGDHLVGFLFFDSDQVNYFTEDVVRQLSVYSELIGSLITGQLALIHILAGALNTVRNMFAYKDGETAAHTQRVGHYARLIASHLADKYQLTDEFLEYILQFAPLHDIGKIGVPDNILFKPEQLDQAEFEGMKLHVDRGMEIITSVVDEFDLGGMSHLEILRNIVGGHHERYNGSGYPQGLKGDEVPLEARIVSAADVLDALTSRRPYKAPWSFEDSIAYMQMNSGVLFDPGCVDALVGSTQELSEISDLFPDEDILPGINT